MTKPKEELLQLLKSDIKAFNQYREETNYEEVDLTGIDLSVTNLCRVDLRHANLKECDLAFSYLHSSNLSHANMEELDVGRADLTEATLEGANLKKANLSDAILYASNLSNVDATEAVFTSAKIREANFTASNFTNADLSECDFNGVNFDKACLKGTIFDSSDLSNATNLHKAIFDETTKWPAEESKLPDGFNKTPTESVFDDYDNLVVKAGEEDEYLSFDDSPPPEEIEEEDVSENFDFANLTADQFMQMQQSGPHKIQPEEEEPSEDVEDPGMDEEKDAEESEPLGTPELSLDLEEELPSLGGELVLPEDDFADAFTSAFTQSTPSAKVEQSMEINKEKPVENVPPPTPVQSPQASTPPTPPQSTTPQQSTKPVSSPSPANTPASVDSEQFGQLMTLLESISGKLDSLENEQKQQKGQIDSLKRTIELMPSSAEMVDSPLGNIDAGVLPRIESKIDILAQTDSIDVFDTLLSELAETFHSEQKNVEDKVDKLLELIETVDTSLGKAISEKVDVEPSSLPAPSIDYTDVTASLHEMLNNLQSNLKEDLEKTDQKVEDLATVAEALTFLLERMQADMGDLPIEKIHSISGSLLQLVHDVNQANTGIAKSNNAIGSISGGINAVSSQVNELNGSVQDVTVSMNTLHSSVQKMLDSKEEGTPENTLIDAFYNFEFTVNKEFEKNSSKISELVASFNGLSTKLETLGKDNTILESLETIKNSVLEEIKESKSKTDTLKELFDDVSTKLEEGVKDLLEGFNKNFDSKITGIGNKLDFLIEREPIPKNILNTFSNNISQNFEEVKSGLDRDMDQFSTSLSSITSKVSDMSVKINGFTQQSEEVRLSINELADKLQDSRTNYMTITTKVQDIDYKLEDSEKFKTFMANRMNDLSTKLGEIDQLSKSLDGTLTDVKERFADVNHSTYLTSNKIGDLGAKLDELSSNDQLINIKVSELSSKFQENKESGVYTAAKVDELTSLVEEYTAQFTMINNKLSDLAYKTDRLLREPQSDDELRTIIEHLMLQFNEYTKANHQMNATLFRRLETFEHETQHLLREMDRRVAKINSMIRNVYKSLDSMTDLITDSYGSGMADPFLNNPSAKSMFNREEF